MFRVSVRFKNRVKVGMIFRVRAQFSINIVDRYMQKYFCPRVRFPLIQYNKGG